MSLDEFLFGKISNYYRSKQDVKLQKQQFTVTLEAIKPRLMLIARAVTGVEIDIYPAEREGGFKNLNFFLPSIFYAFPEKEKNEKFYVFRTLYLCEQFRLNYNWQPNQTFSDDQSRAKANEVSHEITKNLIREYPTFTAFYNELFDYYSQQKTPDFSYIFGKFMTPLPELESGKNIQNPSERIKKNKNDAVKTLLKAQNAVEKVESKMIDKKQQQDAAIYHDLEKLRTADEFNGNWKDFDGEDELQEHQEALKELKMHYTVRVDDEAHSVYQSEFVENTQVAEIENSLDNQNGIPYDEWDYVKRMYKKDFCTVYIQKNVAPHPTFYANTLQQNKPLLNRLRKTLASFQNKWKQQTLQPQGTDFDLDAVTDFSVSIKSGHSPSDHIYMDKVKKEKDLSILLLLDHSLSSDSYVMNNKVIEVEKQVSILFGELLNEFQVDFSIGAFHSKTRNHIGYVSLKDFDTSWHKAKHCIGSLEPEGYTRIGTALRHAAQLLVKRTTKNRWIVLLSDGKPNDYDRYEGKYGLQDIKQALLEMKSEGIHTYALAIEKQAKYYLPIMFGHNHFQIVSSPTELITALIKLYERIRHQN